MDVDNPKPTDASCTFQFQVNEFVRLRPNAPTPQQAAYLFQWGHMPFQGRYASFFDRTLLVSTRFFVADGNGLAWSADIWSLDSLLTLYPGTRFHPGYCLLLPEELFEIETGIVDDPWRPAKEPMLLETLLVPTGSSFTI